MLITAIVVNFNAGEFLQRCVRSLLSGSLQPQVRVTDNASTDGSGARLRNLYGSYPAMEVLVNPKNVGFAAAVNASVRSCQSPYVLVINPDCTIEKNTLELLVKALESDQDAALAAPAVADSRGRLEKAAIRRFPTPLRSLVTMTGLWRFGHRVPALRGVPLANREVPRMTSRAEAVSGACMLIRRDRMIEAGLLDEQYGLHCEDLDLMFRFREKGWHCLFVPEARATHEQGVSSRSRPAWVHKQKHRGMARFYGKFQAGDDPAPLRWLVYSGIWLRYLLLLPLVWIRK